MREHSSIYFYTLVYIFLPIGKYAKRGEPIFPSVYTGNALMLLLLFQRATGMKKKNINLFLDRYWSRLPTKRGYTSCYENDRKFLPGAPYRDFIAEYTYTPSVKYIKYITPYAPAVNGRRDSVIILYWFPNKRFVCPRYGWRI